MSQEDGAVIKAIFKRNIKSKTLLITMSSIPCKNHYSNKKFDF